MCRATTHSSSVATTRTSHAARLITAAPATLRSVSSWIPRCERPSQIAARTSGECSPIPPVNTSSSRPRERGREGAQRFARLVAEAVDRACGPRIRGTSREQVLHVRRRAGERQEAAFAVDEPRERLLVVTVIEQVEHHAGIEVARARPHDETTGRREPHRRVDRAPVADGDHARAVAQVREHRTSSHRLDLCYVLVRESVNPVAAYSRVEQRRGKREPLRDVGQRAVKRRVEARHLGHVAEPLAYGGDRGELDRQMLGRERDRALQRSDERVVDERRLEMVRAAVDEPMTDRREPPAELVSSNAWTAAALAALPDALDRAAEDGGLAVERSVLHPARMSRSSAPGASSPRPAGDLGQVLEVLGDVRCLAREHRAARGRELCQRSRRRLRLRRMASMAM